MPSYLPREFRISGVSHRTAAGRVRNELRIYLSQLKEKVIGARLQNTRLLRLIDRVSLLISSQAELTTAVKRLIAKLLGQLELLKAEVLERRPPGASTILNLIKEVESRLGHLVGEQVARETEAEIARPDQPSFPFLAAANLLQNQREQTFRAVIPLAPLTLAESRNQRSLERIGESVVSSPAAGFLVRILQEALRDFARTTSVQRAGQVARSIEQAQAKAIEAINRMNKLLGEDFARFIAENTVKPGPTAKAENREKEKELEQESLNPNSILRKTRHKNPSQASETKATCRVVTDPVTNQPHLEITGRAQPAEMLKVIDTLVRHQQTSAIVLPLLIETAIDAALNPEGKEELMAILSCFIPEISSLAKTPAQPQALQGPPAQQHQLAQLLSNPAIAVEPKISTVLLPVQQPTSVDPLKLTIPAPLPDTQNGQGIEGRLRLPDTPTPTPMPTPTPTPMPTPTPIMAAQEPVKREPQVVVDLAPALAANRVVQSALIKQLIFAVFSSGQESIFMATETGQKAVAQLARQLANDNRLETKPSANKGQAKPAVAAQSPAKQVRALALLDKTFALLNLNQGQATTFVGNIQVEQAAAATAPAPNAKLTPRMKKEVIQTMRELAMAEKEAGVKITQETVNKIYGALAAVNLVPEIAPPAPNLALPQQTAAASSLERIVRILERQVIANEAVLAESAPARKAARIRTPEWLKETTKPETKFVINAREFLAGIIFGRFGVVQDQAIILANIDHVITALRQNKHIEGLYQQILKAIEAQDYDGAISFLSDLILEANILAESGLYSPELIDGILYKIALARRQPKTPRQPVAA